MGCVHHIVDPLILETINSMNHSPTKVFHFLFAKKTVHMRWSSQDSKPIINHSPIWSTNEKLPHATKKWKTPPKKKKLFYSVRRGSPPKSVSVALLLGKKTRGKKISFPNSVIVYHVRAEVNEPHRTARIAEELQQDRLQIHGENPWERSSICRQYSLFVPRHLKSQKSWPKSPSLAFWYCIFLSSLVTFKDASNMERSTVLFKLRLLHCMSRTEDIPTLSLLPVAIDGIGHLFFGPTKISPGSRPRAWCVLQSGPRKIQV